MPDETVVDRLYQDFEELLAGISGLDLSLQITVRITFSKSLLMAVAGYFEEQVQRQVVGFVDDCTGGNELTKELVIRRAFGRQYHSLFSWDAPNANTFYRHFGGAFYQSMRQYANENQDYQASVRAFLEIGNARNELAHGNYASYQLEKTFEEIYESYKTGLRFVESIGSHLARVSSAD